MAEPPTVRSPSTGTNWRKLFPDAKRSKVDFLIDGSDYFESIVRALESANDQTHFIYILGWMIDIDFRLLDNDKDKTLFKLLETAARKNVEIRILIWDNLFPEYFKLQTNALPRLNKLTNTKAFADPYTFFPQPSKQIIQNLTPLIQQIVKKFGYLIVGLDSNQDISPEFVLRKIAFIINSQTIGAHHEKIVIVNGDQGLVAFCGGIDFNKNRVISALRKKEHWFPYYHDAACRLEGPAAFDVLQIFVQRWANHREAKSESLRGPSLTQPKEKPAPYPYSKVVRTFNSVDGRTKERTLQKAYFDIIDNAKQFIYIEDQYMVNLEVARRLNKKLQESNFTKLTFAIQDSIETSDLCIPNRKRDGFFTVLVDGLSPFEKDKVLIVVMDRTYFERERYHPGQHAKSLIADDEIAMIGSANVNRRSFSLDSETSVVVFDEPTNGDRNFARSFRISTSKDLLRRPVPKDYYESWYNYFTRLSVPQNDFSKLIRYPKHLQDDLDIKINAAIKSSGVIGAVAAYHLTGKNLQLTSAVLSPFTIIYIFDNLFDHFLDASGD